MIDFYKIEGKILTKRNEPTGDLKDWMLKNNLNINKYYVLFSPSFIIHYKKKYKMEIDHHSVYETMLTDVYKDLKYLEGITDKIFIFHNECEPFGDRIRICPFLDDNNLRQYLRGKKLERVLKDEEGL